jgi:hypothetical protein
LGAVVAVPVPFPLPCLVVVVVADPDVVVGLPGSCIAPASFGMVVVVA